MRLWKAPNRAGVPGALASEVINAGFVNSNIGKGALFSNPDNASTPSVTVVEWLSVDYDDLGFTNFPDNDTEFIIPPLDPPINTVRFFGMCEQDSGGAAFHMTVRLQKNSNHLSPRVQQMGDAGGLPIFRYQHWTAFTVPVVAGDAFVLEQFNDSGGARFLQGNTWFGIIVNS